VIDIVDVLFGLRGYALPQYIPGYKLA